jgi:PAS domain S-box-containing protein
MNQVWARFKAFWTAEEVPRWIGLLLVLVFLVAVGVVAYTSHCRIRTFALSHVAQSNQNALRLLAELIDPGAPDARGRNQDALHRFARAHACRELRVYDERLEIVASTNAEEIGRSAPSRDEAPPTVTASMQSHALADTAGTDLLLLRYPVRHVGGSPKHVVEGLFEIEPPSMLVDPLQLWAFVILLSCAGMFLLIYRRMRRHFRSVAEIAEHLVNVDNVDDLERELVALRLGDVQDTVSQTWNKLIDLTVSLREQVARSTASHELVEAISKTKGGELAEAMNTASLGIILVAEHGNVLYANAMAGRLCGWNRDNDQQLQLNEEGMTAEGLKIAESIRSCIDQTSSFRTVDLRLEASDGSFYQLQVRPVRTQQQSRRWAALILDVSQQVRADRAREEFVSQVTHELRTPLTNIRAYTETLSSGMFDDPTVITECYNVITKETRRLSRLVEDILSISQLEVGTMQLVFDTVELQTLLTEAVRDVRGLAESKNIDLQIVLPPKLEPIQADRDKLAVVVNNLLGNAIKYTPQDGQVILSCKATDDEVLITVKDTGIGVAPEDQQRIFEKFQRANDPSVQSESGTGIGLTTAREIVRHHGGDITLMSAKHEGSTFTATVPRRQATRSPAAVAAG